MKHQNRRRRMAPRPWAAAALSLAIVLPLPAAPVSEIDISQGCVTGECHGDLKTAEFLHGPVNLNECEPCHVPIDDKHVFKDMGSPRDTCLICHQTQATMPVLHEPFETSCTACHDPHQADNRYFVMGGTGAEGCNRCHDDVRSGLAHLHGPVALGECLACHTPHQAEHPGLLIEDRPSLCLGCHIDVAHDLERGVSVHEPVAEKCAGCHEPHGGSNQFFHPAVGQELCNTCHADFMQQVAAFEFSHDAMTAEGECLNCHAAHSASRSMLLNQDVGSLCLSCHDQPVEAGGRTLADIGDQIANAKFLHGPLRENNCAGCHEAHGSDSSRLLDKEFPEEFYTEFEPEKYDLCFECHDRRIITEETTTATAFRNGRQNLHFLHVNREKGRSCRACHHEHASNQPHHIRSEVPFGRWMMKVAFEPTETGGGCTTGCHLPYEYDRENPVEIERRIQP